MLIIKGRKEGWVRYAKKPTTCAIMFPLLSVVLGVVLVGWGFVLVWILLV